MGFLTPLYIAGALAVSLPLLFHLIRRTPKGETAFSSLMFLSPSPPRITRRSRLDQLLLLLLRGAALILLALAFSRPFLRQAVNQLAEDSPQERIAILLDTSVSMRREDLWQQAVAAADETMAKAGPLDQIGVYVFDETLRPIASFDDLAQAPRTRRRIIVAERLAGVTPGWSSTQLGQAIVEAIDAAGQSQDSSERTGWAPRRIVLISDMQSGSRIDLLGEYAWPEDVQLDLKVIAPARSSNAGLQRLADESQADALQASAAASDRFGKLRVRVSNAVDSQVEQFRLQWLDAGDKSLASPIDAYVPVGESRVVRVSPPESGAGAVRLQLAGDAHSFDNAMYYVPRLQQELKIGYCGVDGADDPQENRYYLETALLSDSSRGLSVEAVQPGDALALDSEETPPLFVVTAPPARAQCETLHKYMQRGGAVLYVLGKGDDGASLGTLVGVDHVAVEEAEVNGYAMLRDIDFAHPLFAPMAPPQFNDFTQIRFWNYRVVDEAAFPSPHVAARFEGGSPAAIEQRVDAGRLLVFTASWKPSDGQLARSWKFLLMMSSLIEHLRPDRDFREDYVVNQPAPLPEGVDLAEDRQVIKPDGSTALLAEGARAFSEADQPGVYSIATVGGVAQFAVNIDSAESATSPLAIEQFEQLGCRISGRDGPESDADSMKQLRDIELEQRQSIWKWLIVVVLAILMVETWLAGRISARTAVEMAPA